MKRIAIVFCALLAGCMSHWKGIAIGYRLTRATARFAESFDQGLKGYLSRTMEECKKKHQPKTPEMGACLKKALELSWAWTGEKLGKKTGKGILPNLQKGQASAKYSLDGTFDYLETHGKCPPKGGGKCNAWLKLLQPSLCAAWPLFQAGMEIGQVKRVTDDATYTMISNLHRMACK